LNFLQAAMGAFSAAEFVASVGQPEQLPPPGPPECAFAGRSNVGKSSAINALTGRKRLAFTSKTPGRTQTINFYRLAGGALLADLPGYGFARVPLPLRRQWGELVNAYLRGRSALAAVVVVMDARHPLTPLDEQLLDWLRGTRLLVLLSKSDKLSRREQQVALAMTQEKLTQRGDHVAEVRLFSSLNRQGVEECRELLEGWLQAGTAVQPAQIKNPR
jgi:GTP-binding protein